jgi:hypothetical protein
VACGREDRGCGARPGRPASVKGNPGFLRFTEAGPGVRSSSLSR